MIAILLTYKQRSQINENKFRLICYSYQAFMTETQVTLHSFQVFMNKVIIYYFIFFYQTNHYNILN